MMRIFCIYNLLHIQLYISQVTTFWASPFPVLHHVEIFVYKMEIVHMDQKPGKSTFDEKFGYAIAFILKRLKKQFLSTSNSATEWSERETFSI